MQGAGACGSFGVQKCAGVARMPLADLAGGQGRSGRVRCMWVCRVFGGAHYSSSTLEHTALESTGGRIVIMPKSCALTWCDIRLRRAVSLQAERSLPLRGQLLVAAQAHDAGRVSRRSGRPRLLWASARAALADFAALRAAVLDSPTRGGCMAWTSRRAHRRWRFSWIARSSSEICSPKGRRGLSGRHRRGALSSGP